MATTKATYYQPGNTLDYVNSTSEVIPANTIVSLTTRVGVIGRDIEPGAVGVVHVTGVYKMPKVTGALNMGTAVFLNTDGKITATASSNIPAGYVAGDAGANDDVVLVKLLG